MAQTTREYGDQGYVVAGERREGTGDRIPVFDPATEQQIATVPEAGPEGVDEAISVAEAAQAEWIALDATERGRRLRAVAERLREAADRIGEVETREVGRPLASSVGQVKSAAGYFEYYAGLTDKLEGKQIPIPGDGTYLDYTIRDPYGVTAHIVPWNASVVLAARSFGPALAAGNSIVAKAPSPAPLSLLELGELASDAGLPDGLLNVITGSGSTTGDALVSDRRVQAVEFTGSTGTGKHVMRSAAEHVVPVHLELGGKGANLIFPDADLDGAIESIMRTYGNAGQICFAPTRIFVHEAIYDEVTERAVAEIEEMELGPGIENPDMGPVITADAQETVATYVEEAVADGARVLVGGEIPRDTGHFYAPTLLDEVDDTAPVACEEVFGPVFTVHKFSDTDEAVQRANATKYGLNNLVWTSDLSRAHTVAARLESGTVMVNDYPILSPAAVSGGYKESGLGRSKGAQAIKSFTQTKNVVISLED